LFASVKLLSQNVYNAIHIGRRHANETARIHYRVAATDRPEHSLQSRLTEEELALQ